MYGTDPDFADWLTARGLTVSGTPAVLRQLGSDYIDTYEGRLTGYRTDPDQDDAWPRTGALINCLTPVADDVVPSAVVKAAYRAAYLADSNPGILTPVIAGPRVKRQKADVLEREFFDDGAGAGFIDPAIDGALGAFICVDDGNGFFFASIGS